MVLEQLDIHRKRKKGRKEERERERGRRRVWGGERKVGGKEGRKEGQTGGRKQKNFDLSCTLYTYTRSKWIMKLNIKYVTIKLLEK